ncbi:MAG: PhoX family phosphatase [Bdellovibrionales bacterium]
MMQTRRQFLEFMGRNAAGLALSNLPLSLLAGTKDPFAFKPLKPRKSDSLELVEGLKSEVLFSWGDTINDRGDTFGFDCDFTAFIPLRPGATDDGFLWVNHESTNPFFVNGLPAGTLKKTAKQMEREQKTVGGSLVRMQKKGSQWKLVKNDSRNRRFDALTKIPFVGGPIQGSSSCIGTMGNCGGGVTPWNTFLSCEENTDYFYGEAKYTNDVRTVAPSVKFGWDQHLQYPPEHYGWVTEINPFDGTAKKLVGLGRFAHEGAMVVEARDGRLAVYMGDDAADQCLYKFISEKPGSLEKGTLYIANIQKKNWISLDREKNEQLKKTFENQTELLVRTREAAKIVGGTPLDRPEDIKYDPLTKSIVVSLTNNVAKGNHFGSLLRLQENKQDPLSMTFETSTFVSGGTASGLACPDNLMFDPKGNLWITNDISGVSMNKKPYESFGNNGLYVVPAHGPHAGKVLQVASAPNDAELAGPFLSPDKKTIFLSVQHPGETSTSLTNLTSHWPSGKGVPKPSVVAISGPLLDRMMGNG